MPFWDENTVIRRARQHVTLRHVLAMRRNST